jgi:glycerol-3-phosphate acyltransferase PlsX
MRIGIDVMGGDNSPDAILAGAISALDLLDAEDRITLVGDETIIRPALEAASVADDARVEVLATTQVIDMAEPPTSALRNKPDSSIARLAKLGGRKTDPAERADVIISAGNTGACVAAAQMMMRRLPGVHRPGIAVTLPTFFGPVVVCDAGANIAPKPSHLHQYGHMASIYAHHVLGIEKPRVGLLSIGGEEGKGTGIVKETTQLMRADKTLNYIGYVEGRDLFAGTCDVMITDGFTGNVVLKLSEGLASGLFKTIAKEIADTDMDLAARFQPVIKSIYRKHDYHEYGGAPLLGANGNCLICHGSSEARTIRNAIAAAIKIVRHNVNENIVRFLDASAADEVEA